MKEQIDFTKVRYLSEFREILNSQNYIDLVRSITSRPVTDKSGKTVVSVKDNYRAFKNLLDKCNKDIRYRTIRNEYLDLKHDGETCESAWETLGLQKGYSPRTIEGILYEDQ